MDGLKGNIDEVKNAKIRKELARLLAERGRVKRLRVELEEEEKIINAEIIPLMKRAGYKCVFAPDDTGEIKSFGLVAGTSSTLDRKMLLTKGVDPAVIAECTKVTTYETLSVRDIRQIPEED